MPPLLAKIFLGISLTSMRLRNGKGVAENLQKCRELDYTIYLHTPSFKALATPLFTFKIFSWWID